MITSDVHTGIQTPGMGTVQVSCQCCKVRWWEGTLLPLRNLKSRHWAFDNQGDRVVVNCYDIESCIVDTVWFACLFCRLHYGSVGGYWQFEGVLLA